MRPLLLAWAALGPVGCGITEFPEPTHRATGNVGQGGDAATDGARGVGCDGSRAFPSTPVLDAFDRPDGPVGPDWIGGSANFTVQNGTLSGDAAGGDSMFWHERFGADQEIYATFVAFDPELYDMSLIFKAQSTSGDDCTSLRVRYANGFIEPHSVTVTKCEGTTFSILRDHEIPSFHFGARLGARVSSNGCIEVFADDANPDGGHPPPFSFLFSVSDPTFSSIAFPGYVGVYSEPLKSGGPGVASVWDDFGAGVVR